MAGPKLPDAVRWYEGMRLAPHHFRQQDMRNEYLSGRMRLEADPLDWGLLELALSFNGPELPNGAKGYAISLTEIADADQYYIGLDRPARATHADMVAWLKDAVIGLADQFADLIRTRSSGIAAEAVAEEDAVAFGGRPGLSVFLLQNVGARQPDFRRDATLRVVGPRTESMPIVPLQLVLMGKPRAATAAAGRL